MAADEGVAIADAIRRQLALKRMSRQQLAAAAGVSISTLEKGLAGLRPFTLPTLVRLEKALGASLRGDIAGGEVAPDALGGYARAAVNWLERDYLTLRPSFERPETIYAYRTIITWDPAQSCLVFHESERRDAQHAQRGMVAVPSQSGHVYLHTNEKGQLRTAILGRPLVSGEMFGLLSTLVVGQGTQLIPTAVPLALLPLDKGAAPGQIALGQIARGHAAFLPYREHLDRVLAQDFARLGWRS
jgi:transcriptional regulator with XRE-family HTH domain